MANKTSYIETGYIGTIAPADHSEQDVQILYGSGKSLVISSGFVNGQLTKEAQEAITRKQDAHGRENVQVSRGRFSRINLDEVR